MTSLNPPSKLWTSHPADDTWETRAALADCAALDAFERESRGDSFLFLVTTHILNQDIVDAVNAKYAALHGAAPRPAAIAGVPLVPPGPGGAAVPNQLPTDWAYQLWDYIDTTYGRSRQTGLLESNQDTKWSLTKITDVGIDRETIRRFYGHLSRLNRCARLIDS